MLVQHPFRLMLPFVLGAIVLEIAWFLLLRERRYPWREMLASLAVYVLRIPARLLAPLVTGPIAFFLWSHRLASVPLDTAWGLAALFLGTELAYYWMHRAAHEVRWLWASHVVHHTPEHIHLASAVRLGATELLSGSWVFFLPLYLVGFHPLAVGGMLALNLSYQFWLHTEAIGRLGPLEWLLNTPSHHRVHHASNEAYLDRNYGGILIVWDRLFGTLAVEQKQTEIRYGLAHPIGSHNPFVLLFHEWAAMARDVRHATSWRGRLAQLFGRPSGGRAAAPGDRTALSAAE